MSDVVNRDQCGDEVEVLIVVNNDDVRVSDYLSCRPARQGYTARVRYAKTAAIFSDRVDHPLSNTRIPLWEDFAKLALYCQSLF